MNWTLVLSTEQVNEKTQIFKILLQFLINMEKKLTTCKSMTLNSLVLSSIEKRRKQSEINAGII